MLALEKIAVTGVERLSLAAGGHQGLTLMLVLFALLCKATLSVTP